MQLQAAMRGKRARASRRFEDEAATKIQAIVRGKKAMRRRSAMAGEGFKRTAEGEGFKRTAEGVHSHYPKSAKRPMPASPSPSPPRLAAAAEDEMVALSR